MYDRGAGGGYFSEAKEKPVPQKERQACAYSEVGLVTQVASEFEAGVELTVKLGGYVIPNGYDLVVRLRISNCPRTTLTPAFPNPLSRLPSGL